MSRIVPQPPNLAAYFCPETPLGPVDASQVTDPDVAAYLLSLENEALLNLAEGRRILLGRRGAGKSSALSAFSMGSALPTLMNPYFTTERAQSLVKSTNDLHRKYSLILNLKYEFESRTVIPLISDMAVKSPERSCEIWEERIWVNTIKEISKSPALLDSIDFSLRNDILKYGAYAFGSKNGSGDSDFYHAYKEFGLPSASSFIELCNSLRSELCNKQIEILVLIDSGEEYDVYDANIRSCIGGILALIAKEQKPGRPFRTKLALTSEIYRHISQEMNPTKYDYGLVTLQWTATEIVRIITNRMLICLSIHDPAHLGRIGLSSREQDISKERMIKFWDDIFTTGYQNESLKSERRLFYILRHTQMLPRQIVNFLTDMILESRRQIGIYSVIDGDVFERSIRKSCDSIISGIQYAYKSIFPNLLDKLDRFLPNCEIVMGYDDLVQHFKSSHLVSRADGYTSNGDEFLRALVEIGALGVLDESRTTAEVISATYAYSGVIAPNISKNAQYVMHPAFSNKFLSGARRVSLDRIVVPVGHLDNLI